MATEVIMPALSPAQETGILIEWFKEEGFDKIKLIVKSHFNSIPTSQVNMNGIKC